MNKLIYLIESEQVNSNNIRLKFKSGDLIEVKIWVIEGLKKRLQSFEGIVISIKNKGFRTSFILRKISYGVGVEKGFKLYSPYIFNILVKKYGLVNKSKLYYLRYLVGKSARIKERKNKILKKA